MRIEIVREAADRLSRQVWVLTFTTVHGNGAPALRLYEFDAETRATLRHKYRSTGQWAYEAWRRSSVKVADLPLPDDVIAEAKAQIVAAVGALEVERG